MPTININDSGLGAAFGKLGTSLFPDASKVGLAELRGAQTRSALAKEAHEIQKTKDLQTAAGLQGRIGDVFTTRETAMRPLPLAGAEDIALDVDNEAVPSRAELAQPINDQFSRDLVRLQTQLSAGKANALRNVAALPGISDTERMRFGAAGGTKLAPQDLSVAGAERVAKQEAADAIAKGIAIENQKPVSVGRTNQVLLTPDRAAVLGVDQKQTGPGFVGDEGESGPFPGTSVPAANNNIILKHNNRISRGEKPTAEDALTYSVAFHNKYAPKKVKAKQPNGSVIVQTITPTIPGGIRVPAGFAGHVKNNTAPPGSDADIAARQVAGDPGAEDVGAETTGLGETPAGSPATGPDGEQVLSPAKGRFGATGEQNRRDSLNQRFLDSTGELFALYGYDAATDSLDSKGIRPKWTDWFISQIGGKNQLANAALSPQQRALNFTAFAALEPLLRLASGAATPEEEVQRYQEFVPQPSDGEADVKRKLRFLARIRETALRFGKESGFQLTDLAGGNLTFEQRQAVRARFNTFRDSEAPSQGGGAISSALSDKAQAAVDAARARRQ